MVDLLINGVLVLSGWGLFAYGWLSNDSSFLLLGGVLLVIHAFVNVILLSEGDKLYLLVPITAYAAYTYMLIKPWYVAIFWGLFIFNTINIPHAVGTIRSALGRRKR